MFSKPLYYDFTKIVKKGKYEKDEAENFEEDDKYVPKKKPEKKPEKKEQQEKKKKPKKKERLEMIEQGELDDDKNIVNTRKIENGSKGTNRCKPKENKTVIVRKETIIKKKNVARKPAKLILKRKLEKENGENDYKNNKGNNRKNGEKSNQLRKDTQFLDIEKNFVDKIDLNFRKNASIPNSKSLNKRK